MLAALLTHRRIPGPTDTRAETEGSSLPSPFCELKVRSQREKKGPSFKHLQLGADFQGAASPAFRGPLNPTVPIQTLSKALVSHNHQAAHLPCGWLGLAEMESEMQPQALPGSCCLDHSVQRISELSGYICNWEAGQSWRLACSRASPRDWFTSAEALGGICF